MGGMCSLNHDGGRGPCLEGELVQQGYMLLRGDGR